MTGRELRAVWYEATATAASCSAQDLTAWIETMGREPDAFGLYRTDFDGTQTHERDFPRAQPALLAALQWIADHGDTTEGWRPAFHAMRARARMAITQATEGTS